MSSLPFEISKNILCRLEKQDLLQFQLVSKEWYEYSLEPLYSKLTIDTNKKSKLFVRTLSTSPHLGRYLKIIYTGDLFKTKEDELWDKYRLLDTIITHCHNLQEIESSDQHPSFWSLISFARTQQGRLSHLSHLPSPKSCNLESYLCTAFYFKSSLKALSISDFDLPFAPDLSNLVIYQALQTQLNQFINLQSLELDYLSQKHLHDHDQMIESFPNLKELAIFLKYHPRPPPPSKTPLLLESIQPRLDIITLKITWEMISGNINQLKYITRKFTHLQSLEIVLADQNELSSTPAITDNFSEALLDFMHYTNTIKEFEIALKSRKEDIINIFNAIHDNHHRLGVVDIDFYDSSDLNVVDLGLNATSSTLRFPVHEDETDLPHIKFMSAFGDKIQSLTLKDIPSLFIILEDSDDDEMSPPPPPPPPIMQSLGTLDWLYETIQLCPSLQELILIDPTYEESNCIPPTTFRHLKLKKLSLISFESNFEDFTCLHSMSIAFPSLKQVLIESAEGYYSTNYTYGIDMPQSALDLLTLKNFNFSHDFNSEFFIKLKTEAGNRYFIRSQDNLTKTNELVFDSQRHSKKRLYIRCKILTRLLICNNRFTFDWTF